MHSSPKYARIREVALQALLLSALLVAVFPGFFFQGERMIPADTLYVMPPWDKHAPPDFEFPKNKVMLDLVTAFAPFYATTEASLEAGQWPLWNPYEYLGIPLMANVQSAVFYPPRLLHSFLDLKLATSLYVLLKLWLCGMTAFVCARGLGLGLWPSRFFSVAWMLAPYNILWAGWPLPDVAAWLPIVFLGNEIILRGRYRSGLFATAFGGALMLFGGHPETAFAMNLGLGIYFLLRLAFEKRRGRSLWQPIAALAGAWTLALLLFASVLVPFLEYLLHSYTFFYRGDGEPKLPFALGTFVTFWIPRFYGTEADLNFWGADEFTSHPYMMVYPGMLVWLGAALLLRPGEVRRAHRLRIVALIVAACAPLLLAYDTPALEWVNRLPLFRSMYVFYHSTFAVFALPLLATLGLENWFSRPRKLRELLVTLAVLVPPVLLAAVAWHFGETFIKFQNLETYILAQVALAAAFAAAGLVTLGLFAVCRRPRALWAAVLAVFIADVFVAERGMNPTFRPEEIFPETRLTTFLKGLDPPTRVGTGEGYLASGIIAVYGIEELLGYDGLYPARLIQLTEEVQPEAWRKLAPALAVEYYLHNPQLDPVIPLKEEPERFELVAEMEGLQVFRDKTALERAYLVPEARLVSGLQEVLAVASDPAFAPARTALIERPLPEPLPDTPFPAGAGSARVTEHTFTRAEVEVDAPRRSILVLADAYFPGWRAEVDGRPVEIFPVNHVLRGVIVPEGRHRVRYRYAPASFYVGMAISIATCLATLAYAAKRALSSGLAPSSPERRRRRVRPTPRQAASAAGERGTEKGRLSL